MSIRLNNKQDWRAGDSGEDELSQLFAAYRDACPDTDGGADFLPGIWQKIEARQSLWFSFERLARACAAVAVAVCLLFVLLNVAASGRALPSPGGYVDGLAADRSLEGTYYAEGIRTGPVADAGR